VSDVAHIVVVLFQAPGEQGDVDAASGVAMVIWVALVVVAEERGTAAAGNRVAVSELLGKVSVAFSAKYGSAPAAGTVVKVCQTCHPCGTDFGCGCRGVPVGGAVVGGGWSSCAVV
jgi:hypothetical protein